MRPQQDQEHYLRNTILLIEDSPDAVLLTRRTLQKVDASIRLIVTDDPKDAVDAFMGKGAYARENSRLPFLVFFDLVLKGNYSLALLQRFRQNPITRNAALVVLSASASQEEAEGLMGGPLPIVDFVSKPISLSKMTELIERYRP